MTSSDPSERGPEPGAARSAKFSLIFLILVVVGAIVLGLLWTRG